MEMMVVVAIVALLAAIAIPNLLAARRNANEAAAKATLRTIATSIETYASANGGNYAPSDNTTDDDYLTSPTPPYLTKRSESESYCGATISGYTYNCLINKGDYTITAAASNCGISGSKDYTLTNTNGGSLTGTDCS